MHALVFVIVSALATDPPRQAMGAPVPVGGMPFTEMIDKVTGGHQVGWLCEDYSVHRSWLTDGGSVDDVTGEFSTMTHFDCSKLWTPTHPRPLPSPPITEHR